jgi:hypothetical protein
VRGWLELSFHSIHMHAPASKEVHANALRKPAGDVGPRNWKRPDNPWGATGGHVYTAPR